MSAGPAMRATCDAMPPSRKAPAYRRAARAGAAALACAVALACTLGVPAARAEKADRNKPINVEADRMEYDDLQQRNLFTGRVTLTKGTMTITADRLLLRQDAEGYQYATATGRPATFRQKRDGPGEQYVEGFGLELDYDGKNEIVTFKRNARLRRLDRERVTDDVQGNVIVYRSLTEQYTVEGGGSATGENPTGRVRVVIQPKNAPPEPAAPVPLQPAGTLGGPRTTDAPGSPAPRAASPAGRPAKSPVR